MNENELRALLNERARDLEMDTTIPAPLVRTARRRIVARMATAAMAVVIVAVTAASLAFELRPGAKQVASGGTILVDIDLADYYENEGGESEDLPSRSEVDRHIACMRGQGFDLPDPQRTSDGWAILVADPERYDRDSTRWLEAAFVTCAPPAPPGAGDLIMPGVSQARIEAFRDCMAGQGFQLPEATPTDTGWRFDNSAGGFDFNDVNWRRATFVTCSLEPGSD